MKEFIFEVERRVYGWMKDRLSIEAETPEEALEKLKEMAEDGTKNGWDEDRVGLESSEFDYYEVEYPTVAKMAYYKEPKYEEEEYEEEEDDYFPFSSASIVAYEYKLLYHEKFFEHLHMKRLVIDENIPFPVSTWERSYRYKGYGYNMCRETKKKLLQALKGVNVEEEDVSLYATGGWD